jgi:hypothetical protein
MKEIGLDGSAAVFEGLLDEEEAPAAVSGRHAATRCRRWCGARRSRGLALIAALITLEADLLNPAPVLQIENRRNYVVSKRAI